MLLSSQIPSRSTGGLVRLPPSPTTHPYSSPRPWTHPKSPPVDLDLVGGRGPWDQWYLWLRTNPPKPTNDGEGWGVGYTPPPSPRSTAHPLWEGVPGGRNVSLWKDQRFTPTKNTFPLSLHSLNYKPTIRQSTRQVYLRE